MIENLTLAEIRALLRTRESDLGKLRGRKELLLSGLADLEIEIAVEDEVRDRDQVGVYDSGGAAGFAERHGVLGHRHDFVGSKHEIGGTGDDA